MSLRFTPAIPALLLTAGCLSSSATAAPPPPASAQPVENPVVAQVATEIELGVRVLDAVGAEMLGIGVLWTGSEGMTLDPASSRTDATGIATTRAVLGTLAGPYEAAATVQGLSPVTIFITAVPGPARFLRLSDDSIGFSAVGQTRSLGATVSDSFGNAVPPSMVSWISRDPSIAGVDAAGTVTARAAGTTHVVASSGEAVDSAKVTVAL